MSRSHVKNGIKFLVFLVICIFLVFYIIYLNTVEQPKHQFPQVQKSGPSSTTHNNHRDKQVAELVRFIDQKINDVPFVAFKQTSSAKNSIATILNPPASFCVGDTLVVRVEMFNHLGQRKRWGGDYLHARIHTPNLGAAASGRIEDFNNGSYNVYFALSWEGHVDISIVLYHPSEGASLLWRIRKVEYNRVTVYGYFLNNGQEVTTECGFHLDPGQQEICEYADKEYGEYLYCYKPTDVPCGALISMKTDIKPISYIKDTEKEMFTSSNLAAQIPKTTSSIEVLNCNRTRLEMKTNCKPGEQLPFPSGYFFKQQWYPNNCKSISAENFPETSKCLSGKSIYLMGDSTLRQWIEYFAVALKETKIFYPNGEGWHQIHMAFNPERNFYIQWKKHGHLFLASAPYTVKEVSYIHNEIDHLAGGSQTIIVITLGMHFRVVHLSVFIRRLLHVRQAVEKVFERSPDTKVIIKTENTREIHPDVEIFGNFYGYIQYLLLKKVFSGLNVGMIDAWDMTIAAESYIVHPDNAIIQSQINCFFTFIC